MNCSTNRPEARFAPSLCGGARRVLLPLFLGSGLLLTAQQAPPAGAGASPRPAPETAKGRPKGLDKSNLGDEASKAVETVTQEYGGVKNPLEGLLKLADEKHRIWKKEEASAFAKARERGKTNPCLKVKTFLDPALKAFGDYVKQYELYLNEWSDLKSEMIEGLKKSVVLDGGVSDLDSEVQKTDAEIAKLKEQMAGTPVDDPAFEEVRKANAKLLGDYVKHREMAVSALEAAKSDATARLAQKQLLDALSKEIDVMKSDVDVLKKETTNRYGSFEDEWKAKCLAYMSGIEK